MDTTQVCPNCGRPAGCDAPHGLCAACLMKAGFDTRAKGEAGGGGPAFVPPPVEEIAGVFPQLEILGLLGHGGMGAVYKARQPALGRFVALKILPPKSAEDPGFAERFNREARALARLSHPNIVAVYDFGQAGAMPYFLMEYVEGSTLRQVVQSRRLSPRDTLQIVVQICEALQFAHDEGIVHRDIKPENILLDPKGRVKIADFGIAKVLDQAPQDISLTGAREVVGTAHYMAPEQFEHPQSVDHRADIFSLGVVFYELLTGELPLGKFAPPSQKAQSDARLDGVVLHTLEKEPARRYQQARQVKTDVETIAATPSQRVPPRAQSPPPIHVAVPRPAARSSGLKIAAVVGAAGLAALLLLAGLVAVFFWWTRTPTPASAGTKLANGMVSWDLLNEDQRLVAQWTDRKFNSLTAAPTSDRWSAKEPADLERRLIAVLQAPRGAGKGPRSNEYYQAISTLGALRSTNALPVLRSMAFEHVDRILRSEVSNRRRWMATRALGSVGDKTVVPEMIHLLYHNHPYARWWAQIALVQLTGQNFGRDWKAWGAWWNSQNGQPPFDPEPVHWWKGQAEPDRLAENLAESDRKFVEGLKARTPGKPEPAEADDAGP